MRLSGWYQLCGCLMLLSLAACSRQQIVSPERIVEPRRVVIPASPPDSPSLKASVSSLLGRIEASYSRGQWPLAIAEAERGLRMARRKPELYLWLARSHWRLGHVEEARHFTQLGLRYTEVDSAVERRLQGLLTELGNSQGHR